MNLPTQPSGTRPYVRILYYHASMCGIRGDVVPPHNTRALRTIGLAPSRGKAQSSVDLLLSRLLINKACAQ